MARTTALRNRDRLKNSVVAEPTMDFYSVKRELRRLEVRILFEMVMNQRESKCLIINGLCPFYFRHEGYGFCLSEVLGKGCELQQLEKLEIEGCRAYETGSSSLLLSLFREATEIILP
ncbi:MAG: hypothetical protein ACE144_18705 [Thermodesulfobacteriota bacterium]